MKTSTLLIAFVLSISIWSISQIDHIRKKVEDVGAESQGLFTLRFNNAVNGAPVAYATITIQGNKSILTDDEGKIRFEKKPDGIYPFRFKKEGFISEDLRIEINSGRILDNRYVVSPDIQKETIRIVLVWDEPPADLDAHFIKDGEYRISSRDLKISDNDQVKLECESSNGYGPETVIIKDVDLNAEYTYVVNDYTHRDDENSIALSKSNATVKVYNNGKLQNVWQPSKKQTGNIWMVFTIQNGQIIPTEEVKNY